MVRARACLPVVLLYIASSARSVSAQAPARQPPVLTAFTINGGATSVQSSEPILALNHVVVGVAPTEYRVSRRANFGDAQWLPYVAVPTMRDWFASEGESCDPAGPSHTITLFMQVRAVVGEEFRVVAGQRQLLPVLVESNVLRDVICARVASDSGARDDDAPK
jgi:hypothetical protein